MTILNFILIGDSYKEVILILIFSSKLKSILGYVFLLKHGRLRNECGKYVLRTHVFELVYNVANFMCCPASLET